MVKECFSLYRVAVMIYIYLYIAYTLVFFTRSRYIRREMFFFISFFFWRFLSLAFLLECRRLFSWLFVLYVPSGSSILFFKRRKGVERERERKKSSRAEFTAPWNRRGLSVFSSAQLSRITLFNPWGPLFFIYIYIIHTSRGKTVHPAATIIVLSLIRRHNKQKEGYYRWRVFFTNQT